MLNDKLAKALNDQVNAEFYSAYLYLAMSAAANGIGFKGAANWLFVQAQEEMAHGAHMYEYIAERGATATFAVINQPPDAFSGISDIYEKVLEHEQKVTRLINTLATIAMQETDHAAYQFMMWYVCEQVEEEASASEILDKLRFAGDNKALLLSLDSELGVRQFVNPFPAAAK